MLKKDFKKGFALLSLTRKKSRKIGPFNFKNYTFFNQPSLNRRLPQWFVRLRSLPHPNL
jgi:hypothetical protein